MVEVGNGVPGVSLRVYILLIVGVHLWHLCLWRFRSYGWSMVFTNVYQRSLRKCCTHLIHCNVNTGYRIVCIAGIRHRKGKWIWLNKNKLKKKKTREREKIVSDDVYFFSIAFKIVCANVLLWWSEKRRKKVNSNFKNEWKKKEKTKQRGEDVVCTTQNNRI